MNSYPQKPVVPRPKNVSQGGCFVNGLLGVLLLLIWTTGTALSAAAPNWQATGTSLVSEQCAPGNGQIDPGETVTLSFALKYTGDPTLSNVRVKLLESASVTFADPTSLQSIGDVAKNGTANVQFTFRASGSCGSSISPTLEIFSGDAQNPTDLGSLTFGPLPLGATVLTQYNFSNTGAIAIIPSGTANNAEGKANPYPSTIHVSGVPNQTGVTGERFSAVKVTLSNITYPWSPDLNVVLVHGSQAIALMSDAGGNTVETAPLNGVTITFSDAASSQLPFSTAQAITTGEYKPSNFRGLTTLTGVTPTFDAAATLNTGSHAAFSGDPNGDWKLYIQDPAQGLTGSVAGGWSLQIITSKIVCCAAGQTAPVILSTDTSVSRLGNATIDEDQLNAIIATFNVQDLDAGPETLTVNPSSGNQTIVADGSLVVLTPNGASDPLRQLKLVAPVTNAVGDVTITLSVTDAQGHVTDYPQTFNLHINPINDLPQLSAIPSQKVPVGTETGPINFTVNDVETPADSLNVFGRSSNQGIVPDINIFISGTGNNRTVNVRPATTSTQGDATITIHAIDANGGETTTSFNVSFTAQAGFPSIIAAASTEVNVNEDTTISLPFVVHSGIGNAPNTLTVTATSGATAIIPNSGLTVNPIDPGTGLGSITVHPFPNAAGTAVITATVTEPSTSRTDTETWTVHVLAVNDNPTISGLPAQLTINEDSNTGDVSFTVSDVEDTDPATKLRAPGAFIFTTDNPTLVPAGAVTFGNGTGFTRTLKVTPAANQFGRALITVTVTDSQGGTGSASFNLFVNAVNDAPSIAWPGENGVVTFSEDQTGSGLTDRKNVITLTDIRPAPAGISNEDNQTVTVTAASNSSKVAIVGIEPATVSGPYPASTALTVQLAQNAYTTDTPVEITLTLTDNGGTANGGVNTSTRKFKIAITPVNDKPVIQPIGNATVGRGRAISIPFSVSDAETPKNQLTMNGTVSPSDPTVFPAGSIAFDPSNSFITIVPAAIPAVLPATYTITVTATDLGATNAGDNPLTSDPVSFTLTISNTEPPTLTLGAATVDMDEDTVSTLTATVSDNAALEQARFSFTYSVISGSTNLLQDGVLFLPFNNVTTVNGTTTGTATIAITPQPNTSGSANVIVTYTDAEGFQTSAQFRVNVREVNDLPTLTLRNDLSDRAVTTKEDTATSDQSTDSKLLEFDIGDVETAVGSLNVTFTSSNTEIVPVANVVMGGSSTRRTLTVTPAANKNTPDQNSGTPVRITIRVADEAGGTTTDFFDLTVLSVNDAPTINNPGNLSVAEDASEQTVTLSGITAGPDKDQSVTNITLTLDRTDRIQITQAPSTTLNNGTTTFKYRPIANQSGATKVTVLVMDNGGTANGGDNDTSIEFNITVTSVNDLPVIGFSRVNGVISGGTLNVTNNQDTATGVIPFYIADVETPANLLQVVATSSDSNIVNNIQIGGAGTTENGFGQRSVVVTPVPGAFGTVAITLRVIDGDGGPSTATLNATFVAGANPKVTLNPTSQSVLPGHFSDLIFITITDAQTPSGPFGLTAKVQSTTNPNLLGPVGSTPPSSNLQFSSGTGANRAMVVLPATDQTGQVVVRVTATDSQGNPGSADFTLNIVGERPTISQNLTNQTVNVGETTPAQQITVSDKETFPAFLTLTAQSSDEAVIPNGNIFLLPANGPTSLVSVRGGDTNGQAVITITVTDGEGQTNATAFVVTVIDITEKPTITPVLDQNITKNTPSAPINFTVADKETPAASLEVTASSGNTNLVPNTSANLALSGSGGARSLVITPVFNAVGQSLITLTVRDSSGKTASTQFTVNVRPPTVANDFNGDSSQDIVFEDSNGFLAAWFMSGDDLLSASLFTPNSVSDSRWKVVGSGDFDADGKPDLLFQHSNGSLAVWKLNGVTLVSSIALSPAGGNPDWKAVAVADFNKDGKPDILFQYIDNSLAMWQMNGTTLEQVRFLTPQRAGPGWTAFGAGDVDGDGNMDILFQHTDGTLGVWYMFQTDQLYQAKLLNPSKPGDTDWRAVGVIDLNGDSRPDLLFQNRADTSVAVWYMDNIRLLLGKVLSVKPGGTWQIVAP